MSTHYGILKTCNTQYKPCQSFWALLSLIYTQLVLSQESCDYLANPNIRARLMETQPYEGISISPKLSICHGEFSCAQGQPKAQC